MVCWVIWKLMWVSVVRSACGINKLLLNFGILLLSCWKYFLYFLSAEKIWRMLGSSSPLLSHSLCWDICSWVYCCHRLGLNLSIKIVLQELCIMKKDCTLLRLTQLYTWGIVPETSASTVKCGRGFLICWWSVCGKKGEGKEVLTAAESIIPSALPSPQ